MPLAINSFIFEYRRSQEESVSIRTKIETVMKSIISYYLRGEMVKKRVNGGRGKLWRGWNIALAMVLLLVVSSLSGCEKKSTISEKTVVVNAGKDDGHVSVLTQFLPDAAYGFTIAGFDRAFVGVALSGGGDSLTSRALYRFNISEWVEGTITFHCYCLSVDGSPGSVDAYLVDDFGELQTSVTTTPQDIAEIWSLPDKGIKVGSATPSSGEWFEISIPETLIDEKSSNDILAIVLKLDEENMEAGNVYAFSTYEYAEEHNRYKPYLSWNV